MRKCWILILLLVTTWGYAEQMTLPDALALTLLKNPELTAFDYDIRSADALVLQSSLRPNPQLDVLSEHLWGTGRFSGVQRAETYVLIEQIVELGGKRLARMDEAHAQKTLLQFDYEIKKWEIFSETSQYFIDLLTKQKQIEFNEQLIHTLEEFIPDVKKRVETGKGSILEQHKYQLSLVNARLEMEQAKRDLMIAQQRLVAQWGESAQAASLVGIGQLESIKPLLTLEELLSQLPCSPRFERLQQEKNFRSAKLHLEKARSIPDVNLQAGVRYYNESDNCAMIVGFTIPIPVINRNQGSIQNAREQTAKVDVEWEAQLAKSTANLTSFYQKAEKARDAIKIMQEQILPQTKKAFEITHEGYLAGRYGYLELLEAQRSLIFAEIQYLNHLSEYHKAVAEISGMMGEWQ